MSSSGFALSVENVQKSYGRVRALNGASFKVRTGAISALIGPNGAGKTTLFSIVCGYCKADSGTVDVLGGPPDAARLRGRLSALPQDALLGRDLDVQDQLRFLALLSGVPEHKAQSEVERCLDLVGLRELAKRRAGEMSHGQQKRVGVAQAFLGTPDLILLDEPTAGLDPRNAAELRDVIRQQRGQRAIVVSSHNLQELEEMCDEATFIEAGKTVDTGAMDKLTSADSQIALRLGKPLAPEIVQAAQASLGGNKLQLGKDGLSLVVQFTRKEGEIAEDEISRILLVLLQAGAKIGEVERGRSLEQTYLQSTQGK